MDDLVSVIILLRSWNNIPLLVGFLHRGKPWHINPVAVIEDQRVWSNRNTDRIWVKLFYPMKKSMIGMLPLRSSPANQLAGPPSPCRSALDVVASFTTPVDIVSMHNLFLQDVVNGMAYVHVMCVIRTWSVYHVFVSRLEPRCCHFIV